MTLLAAFTRWLFTGKTPPPAPVVCRNCERGVHVHNIHTDVCITPDCECRREVTS